MRTAFVVFDRMTALDFVGVYDVVTRLRSMHFRDDFSWEIAALTAEVTDDRGLRMATTSTGESLAALDLVVVAGGFGTRALQHDPAFIDWLRTAAAVPLKASVCTGALLLGAAGFLRDLEATTHASAFAELAPYCRRVVNARVVDQGNVVTAGGVTSAIDLGLHLVERIAGSDARAAIGRQIEYER